MSGLSAIRSGLNDRESAAGFLPVLLWYFDEFRGANLAQASAKRVWNPSGTVRSARKSARAIIRQRAPKTDARRSRRANS
jgi:hypothetical protein